MGDDNARVLTCGGRDYTVKEIAEKLGISRRAVQYRISKFPDNPCKVIQTEKYGFQPPSGKRKRVANSHPWKSGPRGFGRRKGEPIGGSY